MKVQILLFAIFFNLVSVKANSQSCDEVMKYVKSKGYGTTYTSYNSDAISKVTFYEIIEDYKYYYFAIVCFKRGYLGCSEYIYQVGPRTKLNYSMNYMESAGKAFWEFIQPYNKNLGCGAQFRD